MATVQMATAKKILGCSKTTSDTALRAELGMYALKTIRDMRKLIWQFSMKNMQNKKLPATADRAVWKKVTKGQPVRWDIEVEGIWNEIGGNEDKVLSIGESVQCKATVRGMIEIREKEALRYKVDEREHLKIYGG